MRRLLDPAAVDGLEMEGRVFHVEVVGQALEQRHGNALGPGLEEHVAGFSQERANARSSMSSAMNADATASAAVQPITAMTSPE